MAIAVRVVIGEAGGRGGAKRRAINQPKPSMALVEASAIQEKFTTNSTSSTYWRNVVPLMETTLYISPAP